MNVEETRSRPYRAYSSDLGSLYLRSDGIKVLDLIVSELKSNAEIGPKFSNRYLEVLIEKCLLRLLKVEERDIEIKSQEELDSLLTVLSSQAVDWRIIAPIENLNLGVAELEIGVVKFLNFDNAAKSRMVGEFRLSENETGLRTMVDEELDSLLNVVCAEVAVSAVDGTRAEEIGTEMIETALDVLRFYQLSSLVPHPFFAKNYFGIKGNLHRDMTSFLMFEDYTNIKSCACSHHARGPMRPFTIAQNELKGMVTDNLHVVSDILMKSEKSRTNFERDLVAAIHFCSLSLREGSIAEMFVSSVIALEALMLDEHEAITDNLAERVALIVGKDLDERKWLFAEMKRLYQIRSSIVHSGNTDIRLSDLLFLQKQIVYRCIVNLLGLFQAEGIFNTSRLAEYIRDRKFR